MRAVLEGRFDSKFSARRVVGMPEPEMRAAVLELEAGAVQPSAATAEGLLNNPTHSQDVARSMLSCTS